MGIDWRLFQSSEISSRPLWVIIGLPFLHLKKMGSSFRSCDYWSYSVSFSCGFSLLSRPYKYSFHRSLFHLTFCTSQLLSWLSCRFSSRLSVPHSHLFTSLGSFSAISFILPLLPFQLLATLAKKYSSYFKPIKDGNQSTQCIHPTTLCP